MMPSFFSMRLPGHIAGAKAYSDKLSDSRDINLNVSFFHLQEVTFNWSQLRFLSHMWRCRDMSRGGVHMWRYVDVCGDMWLCVHMWKCGVHMYVEICVGVEICGVVESTCGDMWSCDVSRLWCVVQMWSSGAHMWIYVEV